MFSSLRCYWKGRALHTLCDIRFHNKFTIKHVENAVIFVLLSVAIVKKDENFQELSKFHVYDIKKFSM